MSGRIETKLARRRFLMGAGGATIALPLFFGRERSLLAATGAPERFVSIYFGNGLPADLTAGGLSYSPSPGLTPLAPLVPFANQLTMVRGINAVCVSPSTFTGHIPGSASFCCATDCPDGYNKGGPSLDWAAYQYFQSLQAQQPLTPIPAVAAGVFGRSNNKPETVRWIHSWTGGGGPQHANPPAHDPLALFHQLFGMGTSTQPPGAGPPAGGIARYQQSVLDAVVAEYKQITSAASPYPAAVRAAISNHLDTIRQLEMQAQAIASHMAAGTPACKQMTPPASMDSQANETTANYQTIWPVMSDLYLLGLQCDLFRFGNVLLTMGGDIYPSTYMGQSATNTHGEWFHFYPTHRPGIASVITWEMQMIAQFLDKMNKIADPQDPSGKTLLDNTTVLIGTELSEPELHSRQGMTFFLAGAKGRFKGGTQNVGSRSDTDLYNTVLQSMGLPPQSFGKPGTFTGLLSI